MRYLTNFSDSFVTGHSREQKAVIFERAAADTRSPVVVRRHGIPEYPDDGSAWSLACCESCGDLSDFWDRVGQLEKSTAPEGRPLR
jgi:hypothetical protein